LNLFFALSVLVLPMDEIEIEEKRRKEALRSEKLRQRYRDWGFVVTTINIAPGTRKQVQKYALLVAKKLGIQKYKDKEE